MIRQCTPWRASSLAIVRPTGPAPTTSGTENSGVMRYHTISARDAGRRPLRRRRATPPPWTGDAWRVRASRTRGQNSPLQLQPQRTTIAGSAEKKLHLEYFGRANSNTDICKSECCESQGQRTSVFLEWRVFPSDPGPPSGEGPAEDSRSDRGVDRAPASFSTGGQSAALWWDVTANYEPTAGRAR